MRKLTPKTDKYLEAALARAKVYQRAARSDELKQMDERHWQAFSNFIGSKDPWDATDEEVAAWCARLMSDGYKYSTLKSAISCLRYIYGSAGKGSAHGKPGKGIRKHNPAMSDLVRSTLRGIRKVHDTSHSRKAPLMLPMLERLIDVQPDNLQGARNRAMLSVAWGGALRTREFLHLNVKEGRGSGHVQIQEDGLVVYVHRWVGPSRGWQWESVGIPERIWKQGYCPKQLLQKWLELYDVGEGPLFPRCYGNKISHGPPINKNSITPLIRDGIRPLGLPENEYSARSLRQGCLEWLVEEGLTVGQVMQHGRYRTVKSVMPYVRHRTSIQESPFMRTSWCH